MVPMPGPLTQTHKLFLAAYHHNWDDGTRALLRILDDPACDRATALLIYWLTKPGFYQQFSSPEEVPDFARRDHALLLTIEARFAADRYPDVIAFDPTTHAATADAIPAERGSIPNAMFRPSQGDVSADELLGHKVGERAILEACSAGRLDEVIAWVKTGPDINARRSTEISRWPARRERATSRWCGACRRRRRSEGTRRRRGPQHAPLGECVSPRGRDPPAARARHEHRHQGPVAAPRYTVPPSRPGLLAERGGGGTRASSSRWARTRASRTMTARLRSRSRSSSATSPRRSCCAQ